MKERYGRRQEPSRFIGELLFDREKAKEKGTVWHKVYGTGKLLSMKGTRRRSFSTGITGGSH